MNKLKLKKLFKGDVIRIITISLFATLACVGIIKAATNIGSNISTDGTITGSGANTLYGATSIGGALTATSTFSVTGLTTMVNASSTLLSVSGTEYIGGNNGLILADGSITDATGAISFGNENLYTTGSVGIGTTTPQEKLHLAGGNFLQTISSPTIKGRVNFYDANTLYISGKYAYITSPRGDKLGVIDISNPASPVVIASTTCGASCGMDFPHDLWVSGNYAYTISCNSDSLAVTDVSNPKSPQVISWLSNSLFDCGYGIQVAGKYAYVAAKSADTFSIVDVSDPYKMKIVGSITNSTYLDGAHALYISGKYAYVASWTGGTSDYFNIIDISNPTSPQIISSTLSGSMSGDDMYISGKYAYVPDYYNSGINIIDISNPNSPSVVKNFYDTTYLSGINSVFVSGKYAYVAPEGTSSSNRFSIIDVSNPSSPFIAGTLTDPSLVENMGHSVIVSGKYAYYAMPCTTDLHTCNTESNSPYPGQLVIIDAPGIDAPGATIGNINASSINVDENAEVGHSLYIRNALSVGSDIVTGGIISVTGTSTNSYIRNNLSIGTSTPSSKLTVWDDNTSGTPSLSVVNSASTTSFSVLSNGKVVIGAADSAYNGFSILGSPATATIDSQTTGLAGFSLANTIGNWIAKINANDGKFVVRDSNNAKNPFIIELNSPTNTLYLASTGYVGIGSSTPWKTLSVTGTVAFNGLTTSNTGNAVCITTSKEITDAGAASCVPSALQFKKDISDITSEKAKNIMLNIEPVEFTRKDNNQKRFGFIADWSEKLDKRLIEYKNGAGEIWSFDYMGFTSVITKFVQDLHADFQKLIVRVSGVENKINNQQAQIDELRNEIKELKK